MSEIWKDIPGFEGRYAASTYGRIKGLKRGTIRKFREHRQGYLQVNMWVDGKVKTFMVHQLIALTFLGPRPERLQTCHSDGNNQNNSLSNLRYDTVSENTLDKVRHGTHHESIKTHCPQGHEYNESNTHVRRGGSRQCRVCDREKRRQPRIKD